MDGMHVPAGKMVVMYNGQPTLRAIDEEKSKGAKDGRGHPRNMPALNAGEDVAFVVNGPPMIVPKGHRV